jgi:hypothetical protein
VADSGRYTLAALQAEGRRRRQCARQDRKRQSADMADAASNPDEVVLVVVSLPESAAMADDGVAATHRAVTRQQAQRNYPGSELSFASGSAIKRITAGVKARRDRFRQVSIYWPGLHPPGRVIFERKKNTPLLSPSRPC